MCVDMFDYNVLILKSLKNEYNWDMEKKKRLFECESSNSENSITRRNFVHRSENQELKKPSMFPSYPKNCVSFVLFYFSVNKIL